MIFEAILARPLHRVLPSGAVMDRRPGRRKLMVVELILKITPV